MKRSFLFLQGCTSPFFPRLRDRLVALGHQVYRVNYNVGDAVCWGSRPAWHFRESADALPEYLEQKFSKVGFSDVIMLGDTRPVNRPALALAEKYGARVHILEEGYFRPNWLTLEEGGINGYSPLPKDPDWYRAVDPYLPEYGPGQAVFNPISLLAIHDAYYHLPNLLNPVLYSGYRTHRPHISGVEFFGWARRFSKMRYYERRDNAAIKQLLASGMPYYVFPLQLNSDSQIKEHSSSRGIPFVIKNVINSFFRHAPKNTCLVIKNHPLDTGFIDYADWILRLQRRLKLDGRILYIEAGHLPTLLDSTLGVVTINSSVGTSALAHACPMIALGQAIYDIPGLTFQGALEDFWRHREPPDPRLFNSFRKTVVHTALVNGGFYSREGIAMGVENCCQRLERSTSPLNELLNMTHDLSSYEHSRIAC